MSHLEQELLEMQNKIRHLTNIINSVTIRDTKYKETKKKELLDLIAKRNLLENKITESILLDQ